MISIEAIPYLFEEKLEVPLEKYSIPFLLCPVGIVGSGKTTVIKPLSKEFHLVRISTDEIRELFIENKIKHTQDDVYKIANFFIRKYLAEGYGVSIDANCSTKKDFLEKLGKEFNIQLIWIHINPPEEFILEKLKNFNHGRLFADAEEAIKSYMDNKKNHIYLDMPFVYTFDTSKENLSFQIEEAIQIIKNKIKS